jgi:hypothetical protein
MAEPIEVEEDLTDDDVNLEDVEASWDSEDDAESEPAEVEESTEDEDAEEESDTEVETTEEEDTTEEASEEVETKPDEESEKDIKAHNREMAQRRLAAKAEREAQIAKEQQDYVAEADTADPLDIAVRQLQVTAYNNTVESNTNKLTNAYERAIQDFDILKNPSPEIQAEIDAAVDAFQAQFVQLDKYGNPVEVKGDLYTHLQTKADSIARLTGLKVKQQEQMKTKEKSKVLSTPTRAPKEPKRDPQLEAFDEEADRY